MKKSFIPAFLLLTSLQAFSSEFPLSEETIIIAQMLTAPEVQKCIKQIETEYQGHYNIWQVVRRPLRTNESYEDGSAASAAHSTYFFRGNIGGQTYKGPDAIAVDTDQGPVFSRFTCRIVDQMYN